MYQPRTNVYGTLLLLWIAVTGQPGCGTPDSEVALSGSSEPAGSATNGTVDKAGRSAFADVAAEVGLDFVHVNGMSGELYFVEMMGAGAALFDYDGDGDLDAYLVQGHALDPTTTPDSGRVDRLYRNELEVGPDGRRKLRFTDVTEESGIRASGYGMGVATGDYNNDGRTDLYVLNWGGNQLWRNDGDGTFTDVTAESGTDDPRWSTGASFVDFDLDGWLDLVVVNYSRYTWASERPCYVESGRRDYCGPHAYPPEPDRLFRNLGDGTFRDVSLQMGLAEAYGPALGVTVADFDGDGWPDIYVANDQAENQLWVNRNGRRFEDRAALAGAAVNEAGVAEASMGVNAADFDGDGQEDLFMTHLAEETNTLYLNLGAGLLEDRSRESGLGSPSRTYTGFGVASFDYDNDGWLDLFVANGAVRIIPEQAERGEALPLKQTNQLFRNLGRGQFREVTATGGAVLALNEVSRGVAYGDVDNDGDIDLLITNNNGPARLLRNRVGADRPWLGLRLIGGPEGRDMLGARVAVTRPDGRTLWRRVHVDGSYGSAHDPRVHVGLGDSGTYGTVRVQWPGGPIEVWDGLEINRYHTLVRGQGRAADTI